MGHFKSSLCAGVMTSIPQHEINKRGNGVWISTLTTVLSSSEKEFVYNTYVLSVCTKGDDHNPIEDRFQSDFEYINRHEVMFYSKTLNKETKVNLSLIAYLADSPERHVICTLTRGNGNYNLCWGYIFDKRYLIQFLPSCKKFLSNLEKNFSIRDIRCSKCLNWDVSNTEHKLAQYEAPDHYPNDLNDTKNGELKSKKY